MLFKKFKIMSNRLSMPDYLKIPHVIKFVRMKCQMSEIDDA